MILSAHKLLFIIIVILLGACLLHRLWQRFFRYPPTAFMLSALLLQVIPVV